MPINHKASSSNCLAHQQTKDEGLLGLAPEGCGKVNSQILKPASSATSMGGKRHSSSRPSRQWPATGRISFREMKKLARKQNPRFSRSQPQKLVVNSVGSSPLSQAVRGHHLEVYTSTPTPSSSSFSPKSVGSHGARGKLLGELVGFSFPSIPPQKSDPGKIGD